jgi:sortase A
VAVRVLVLVVAAFAILYGCGQASSPVEKQDKRDGVEQVAQGDAEGAAGKGNREPTREEVPRITPPEDKSLRLTVPKMAHLKYDEIPTGLSTDKALFHDYAGVHIKNTGWPWEKVANVYIAGHRLGFPNTSSWLAFWDLNKLERGDEIYITDSEGRKYTYEVYRKFLGGSPRGPDGKHPCEVETPSNLTELKPVEGKNIVTLQTCTLPDYTNRLLLRGELRDVWEV